MNFSSAHILVLGLGESGLAMLTWLKGQGARLRAADSRRSGPNGAPNLDLAKALAEEVRPEPFSNALLEGISLIAVSPGIALSEPLLVEAQARGIPVIGEIELFAQALAQRRESHAYAPKVLAVTGTNGKTTVTALTRQMATRALASFGRTAVACGNISPSALSAWMDVERRATAESDWPAVWVVELSSFQLETCPSLEPDAAVVLNITEDHLDWHGSMAAYAAAKARVFANGSVQILNRDDRQVLAMQRPFVPKRKKDLAPPFYSFGAHTPAPASEGETAFGLINSGGVLWLGYQQGSSTNAQRLMPIDALRIKGLHNATNALAALALTRAIDLPLAGCLKALADYAGEPHRVEKIGHVTGVDYVDDSKGTNVGATVAALNGLGATLGSAKLVLIAGGDGKGQDFAPLAAPVARYVRCVHTLGKDAAALEAALGATQIPLHRATSLEAAVHAAQASARPGDTVLLSPACASLDMFRNYKHRAEVFVATVRALEVVNANASALDTAESGVAHV